MLRFYVRGLCPHILKWMTNTHTHTHTPDAEWWKRQSHLPWSFVLRSRKLLMIGPIDQFNKQKGYQQTNIFCFFLSRKYWCTPIFGLVEGIMWDCRPLCGRPKKGSTGSTCLVHAEVLEVVWLSVLGGASCSAVGPTSVPTDVEHLDADHLDKDLVRDLPTPTGGPAQQTSYLDEKTLRFKNPEQFCKAKSSENNGKDNFAGYFSRKFSGRQKHLHMISRHFLDLCACKGCSV